MLPKMLLRHIGSLDRNMYNLLTLSVKEKNFYIFELTNGHHHSYPNRLPWLFQQQSQEDLG
jgi:hypothetical protein